MIITAKANGDVLNIKPSVFYQGSTEANRIYLIAPFAINSSVSVGFTLPNTHDIPVTLMTPSTVISDTLNTWVYDVPATLTQYVGIVKVNISITTPSGNIITLNRCQFEVKRGDEVVPPDEPEADVYATIVQALADIYANFINKVDANYTDTENDIEQGVINNANGLKLVKTVGDVTVTAEVTENGLEINGVEISTNIESRIATHNESGTAHADIRLIAETAESNSETAVATANEAKETADNAESVALGIDAKASEALSKSESAVDTANEAKAIALSVEQAKVFDTFEDMETWLKDEANKGLHTTGLELLIKDANVPDYWVTAVLETPNANGYYYDIEENEASVLSVNGKKGIVVLKTDDISDAEQTNKFATAEEKEIWNLKEPALPARPIENEEGKYLGWDGTGNKVWKAIPGTSGGLSTANIYLTELASTIEGTYKQLSYTLEGTTTVRTKTVNDNTKLLDTYLFDYPIATTKLDSGTWKLNIWCRVSVAGGATRLTTEIFKRALDGTETILFTTNSIDINNTTYEYVEINSEQPSFDVLATDKIGFNLYVGTTHTSSVVFDYHIGDGKGAYLNIPLALRHIQLRDLNGDDNYLHVTSAEKLSWDDRVTQSQMDTAIQTAIQSSWGGSY